MKELWCEKYRPKKLSDYVFRDERQKQQVASWVNSGAIPHLLFSGSPGTGKTTLAKMLLVELGVDDGDIMQINASSQNSVDDVRNKITNFTSTMPFGEFKYVLLDEADYLSHAGQAALRGVMEANSDTSRFIMTCNYANKIIPALHSRSQGFHIESLDRTEFTARVATILINEAIEIDIDILDTYVAATYPDMRKCINLLQMNSQTGTLLAPSKGDASEADYKLEMVSLFKAKKYKEARILITKQISQEEYEDVFRYMYQNLQFWADTEDKENEAIIIIRNGLCKHAVVADPEINLSAVLVELQILANS